MISAIETVPRLSIHPSRGSWNTRGLRVQRQSIEPACVQNRQHHSNIFSLAGVLIRALINACYDALVSPFSTAPSPSLSLSFSPSPSSSVFLPLVRFPSVPPFSTPTLTSPRNLQRAIRINIHIAGMLVQRVNSGDSFTQSPLYFLGRSLRRASHRQAGN